MRIIAKDSKYDVPYENVTLMIEHVGDSYSLIAQDFGHRRYCLADFNNEEDVRHAMECIINSYIWQTSVVYMDAIFDQLYENEKE